jgi:hypothetical protein
MKEPWTDEERKVLTQHYASGIALCLELLPRRTRASVRFQARAMGLAKPASGRWREEEDELMRQYYPDRKTLQVLLPNRTRHALKGRAKELGLQRPQKTWKASEIRQLASMAQTMTRGEIFAGIRNRTPRELASAMAYHGIRPSRAQPAPTGYPLLESARNRCHELGLTVTEVGRAVGSRLILTRGHHKNSVRIQSEKFCEAVERLGGEFYAEWDD